MNMRKMLLAKLGLFARKSDFADAFALRLDRINMRETRREVRQALFRGFAQSQAA